MANSVDPVETPRSAASHLGLNCLLRPVCPNTYGKYANQNQQHNSCPIYKQTGRHEIMSVLKDLGALESGHSKQHSYQGCIFWEVSKH